MASVSTLGSGTRAIGVYKQRFARATRTVVRVPLGCVRPRQRRHRAAWRARLRRGVRRAGARLRRPALPEGGAGQHGRDLRGRACARERRRRAARQARRARGRRGRADLERHERRWAGAGGEDTEVDSPPVLTLLVGAEREGLPPEAVNACDTVAHIPIVSESLNAAMAATVALYETTRRSNRLTDRGARPKPGDTSLRPESPVRPTGLRPAAPPSRVPPT